MLKTLIYRKYQRRIHHAFITLHPSRYLNTNQKPIVYPNRLTSFPNCIQIVPKSFTHLNRSNLHRFNCDNWLSRLQQSNLRDSITSLLASRINKPPKGKLTNIRFSRYPQPPHITMGVVK